MFRNFPLTGAVIECKKKIEIFQTMFLTLFSRFTTILFDLAANICQLNLKIMKEMKLQ